MVSHLATFDWSWVGYGIIIFFIAIFFLKGIRIIRPTHRAAVETLGKYTRFQKSGITYIIPMFQKMPLHNQCSLVQVQP